MAETACASCLPCITSTIARQRRSQKTDEKNRKSPSTIDSRTSSDYCSDPDPATFCLVMTKTEFVQNDNAQTILVRRKTTFIISVQVGFMGVIHGQTRWIPAKKWCLWVLSDSFSQFASNDVRRSTGGLKKHSTYDPLLSCNETTWIRVCLPLCLKSNFT